eukprot:GEZU01033772.1.p1 GENE.GEZU01033772.1~~GEZU01033772.1.p1  ORF type:complete len:415 (-),score=116.28 GEZU01033772.1:73-1317(-)
MASICLAKDLALWLIPRILRTMARTKTTTADTTTTPKRVTRSTSKNTPSPKSPHVLTTESQDLNGAPTESQDLDESQDIGPATPITTKQMKKTVSPGTKKRKHDDDDEETDNTEETSKGEEEDAAKKKLELQACFPKDEREHKYDSAKQIKIVSWNVNGIRALLKKDKKLFDLVAQETPDVLCIQETKMDLATATKEKLEDTFKAQGYMGVTSCCSTKKGYAGTAVFTKIEPLSITKGLGIAKHDGEGRTITLEFEQFYLINTYVPNSGEKLDRLKYRTEEWDVDFAKYVKGLQEKKPVVWTGDLNVAILDIDVHSPKTLTKCAGFTPQERASFRKMVTDCDLVDSFRHFYPNTKNMFSYWSYRSKAKLKNAGWRLDYFMVSKSLVEKEVLADSYILPLWDGSDHGPIVAIFNK